MQSLIRNAKSRILIAGAGPAGASLAIRLANQGFYVTLIEREKFPRQKLCGEFISPECFRHFKDLGVLSEMLSASGDRIAETVFYAPSGKSVSVPSKWFNQNETALGLSRAEMDLRLLEKARETGVEIFEETSVLSLLWENGKARGVKAKNKHKTLEITADLIIDATGRAAVLGKLAEKDKLRTINNEWRKQKISAQQSALSSHLVGFKTHLRGATIERGRCEIYFFRGGYGGLNLVENGAANHCFLIKAEIVKKFGGDAEKIVREVVFHNRRAFETMKNASPIYDWLAVSVDKFGAKNLNPAGNLLAIGDAGAFIDPFTGSGMLMALESSEILARIIAENEISDARIAEIYQNAHAQNFRKRLHLCKLMRRAAFAPNLAKAVISLLSLSRKSTRLLAQATRTNYVPLNK